LEEGVPVIGIIAVKNIPRIEEPKGLKHGVALTDELSIDQQAWALA